MDGTKSGKAERNESTAKYRRSRSPIEEMDSHLNSATFLRSKSVQSYMRDSKSEIIAEQSTLVQGHTDPGLPKTLDICSEEFQY